MANLVIKNENLFNQLNASNDLNSDLLSNWIVESLTQNKIEIDTINLKLEALRSNLLGEEEILKSQIKSKLNENYNNLYRLEIIAKKRHESFVQKYTNTLSTLLLIIFLGLVLSSVLIMIRIIFFNKE